MRISKMVFVCLSVALLVVPTLTRAEVKIDSYTFGGIEARSIGPAVMGGRIAAIDAVGQDPLTIYVGAASGGVWKSIDGGITFKPVFDDHTQSIGAIRIDPKNPEVVWVGTGETWTRNSVSVGTGVYKTTDGGDHWKFVGLGDAERIARIRIDPEATDTVFVCATGHLWDANEERGVYKTTDGGENWERVLYVDENTGCSDLDIDPQNPQILYAGMWQFRRSASFFTSGGPGSGLYKSTDGGTSWTKLTVGLPEGEKGRIGVAVAPSRPSVVYALVEAEKTALYRSEDLGATWEKKDAGFNTTARPFYFAYIIVDPADYNRVYKPGFFLSVSKDGGKSFTSALAAFGGNVHSDHHALWINPANPNELLLGTDGGVYQSFDRAGHWRFVRALPVSQFYQVSFDMDEPYNVYGGLQDNGSWTGPSSGVGGISGADWKNIGFGDGFYAFRDPTDSGYVYVESQGGNIVRTRLATMEFRDIKPQPGEGEPKYRFNWNTPIHLSPNEKGTIYIGAQFLFRSRDQGESWEKISPDLTTNAPERQRQTESGGLTLDDTTAENNATIYTISESPVDGAVIWVGTDDGHVQVTRDGGESWTNVTANIPDLPAGLWVSSVSASPHAAASAFITVDGHYAGDKAPHVYETADYGATWTSLTTADIEGYAHVVRQDLVNPNLLFVGTEFGLYITLDGGTNWARFVGNLPKVAVHDIAIHPRDDDLILATHGRGVYIIDDITPLRQLTSGTLESPVALLPGKPAVMTTAGFSFGFNGDDEFVGANPIEAAPIVYYLARRHLFGDLKVEIYDAEGELISTIPGGKRRGLNRVLWPMRLDPPKLPPAKSLAPAFIGPTVPEGTYTVKLIKDEETLEGTVQLVADPRSPHSAEDRTLQQKTALDLYDRLEDLTYLVETLLDVQEQAKARSESAGGRLGKDLAGLQGDLETLRATLVTTKDGGLFTSEEQLREKMAALYSSVTFFEGRPTDTQLKRAELFKNQLTAAQERFGTLTGDRLARLNQQLERKNLEPVRVQTRQEWEAAEQGK